MNALNRMKKGCLFVVLLAVFPQIGFSQLSLNLNRNFAKERVILSFSDSSYSVNLDENAAAKIVLDSKKKANYATFYGPRGIYTLYLNPAKENKIRQDENNKMIFEGHEGKINTYLNYNLLPADAPNAKLPEEQYMEQWKKLIGSLKRNLKTKGFSKEFTKLENIRLVYLANTILTSYPLHHSRINKLNDYVPSADFVKFINSQVKEDTSSFHLGEYKAAWKGLVDINASNTNADKSAKERLAYELNFIKNRIADHRLQEVIAHHTVINYMRYYGSDGLEEVIPTYSAMISNPSLAKEFQKLYEQYSRLAVGKKAADFSLLDQYGKTVSLSDFKGKYVYIDVWATWCGPCVQEIPMLEKLAKQLADKNIVFLSISIDKNKETWLEKLKQDKMEGIQLHVTRKDTFQEDYKIGLIPRFLLIDPQGNFVDSKMSRPSEPVTLKRLEQI